MKLVLNSEISVSKRIVFQLLFVIPFNLFELNVRRTMLQMFCFLYFDFVI